MKVVIMCGGNYKDQFETPKPLLEVNNEILIERTIRLLKENGIKDIAISTDISDYNCLDVEILENKTDYVHDAHGNLKNSKNAWLTAYYPLDIPACYLAGDVYWTEEAIKTVINTKVKDTMFICAPDYSDGRKHISIKGREPLGYIVQNQKVFRNAINEILKEIDEGKFTFDPIAWNLYRKLNGIELDYNGYGNDIFKTKGDYLVIDDLTTDIDLEKNIPDLEKLIKKLEGGGNMIRCKVIEFFTLSSFNELQELKRANYNHNKKNELYVGDTFLCTEGMAEYLTGKNKYKRPFATIIEVIPEEKKTEVKPRAKKTTISKKNIAKKN